QVQLLLGCTAGNYRTVLAGRPCHNAMQRLSRLLRAVAALRSLLVDAVVPLNAYINPARAGCSCYINPSFPRGFLCALVTSWLASHRDPFAPSYFSRSLR